MPLNLNLTPNIKHFTKILVKFEIGCYKLHNNSHPC